MMRIVGTVRSSDYKRNWMPKKIDRRWIDVLISMNSNGFVRTKSKWNSIVLVKFGGKYFVITDGSRRVSVAHILGIRYIVADVEIQTKKRVRAGSASG
ncbi:MAG: hypothetical protein ACRDF4_05815 [Rhabdochlamydiaceae bacterium]